MDNNLYFIALLPPFAVAEEINIFKHYIAQHYNSKRALRVMPHITLKAPFTLPVTEHKNVLTWFKNTTISPEPFTVSLKGFGAFINEKNPVIYIKPLLNNSLSLLQKDIILAFKEQYNDLKISYTEQNFSPHITIAYRDLDYTQFEKAWKEFKNKDYTNKFPVNSIYYNTMASNGYLLLKNYYLSKLPDYEFYFFYTVCQQLINYFKLL
ncbi:hypothetical protein GCM10007424_26210 [Flavobacterium suaedae]|uniref:2'-5' RNA ligase family protein n=1 Tax=Flavobacterium suaedae TaxID=1767027 RepID=A0ABQ1K1B7_9FLAO|nr:2'-5' RNA ligase family protein [Flavobacterium suaedae]GGB84913.1 hypothetical protein GCM10007424_26210 [Flavobacterium suaedae]